MSDLDVEVFWIREEWKGYRQSFTKLVMPTVRNTTVGRNTNTGR